MFMKEMEMAPEGNEPRGLLPEGLLSYTRFSTGASLYRHRSQLFGRLWVRLPLPTGQFSEI